MLMKRLDSWLDAQTGWRRAVLVWLLLCPVAIGGATSWWGLVTLDASSPDLRLLGLTVALSLLGAWPITGLVIVAARWRRVQTGGRPVLSWRLYAAAICLVSTPVLDPIFEHVKWTPHDAHAVILLIPVLLSFVGAALSIQHASRQRRRRSALTADSPSLDA